MTDTDEENILPLIDIEHPMVSEEFKIALEAWKTVLASSPPKPKQGSRKTLIREWLDEHYPRLSIEAKNRISVMLNPDSGGGAPGA